MPKKNNKLVADILNLKGKVVSQIDLPSEIFGVKENPKLLAQAVRVYLANQRLGTHSTKTRSEVTGSTRKIYRQKGTGRARHGSIKAPIFIGGGVAHGPRPKDYSMELPQTMRRSALFCALTDKWKEGKIIFANGFENISLKTKNLVETLMNLSLDVNINKRKILIITGTKLPNLLLAGRNIQSVEIIPVSLLNTYSVMSRSHLLFIDNAVNSLKEVFLGEKRKINTMKIKKENKITKTKLEIKSKKNE